MSKGLLTVVGVAASVAIPFAAPAIAASIGLSSAVAGVAASAGLSAATAATVGGVVGAGLVGAGLGAANAALTGGNVGRGALFGAVGAGAAGFGSPASVAGSTGGAAGGGGTAVAGGLPPVSASVAAPSAAAVAANGAAVGAGAGAGLGSALQQGADGILQSGINALTDPSTLARITLLAASGQDDGLTSQERSLVAQRRQELNQLAATDQALFEEQLQGARDFLQQAKQQAPNPQQAFAETKIAAERQLADNTRGVTDDEARAARRRAGIGSAQAGATAAAAEERRGRATQLNLQAAGLNALPKAAPDKAGGLQLALSEQLAERKRQTREDLVNIAAGVAPKLFGSVA